MICKIILLGLAGLTLAGEPDVFQNYFDDTIKEVDIPLDAAIKACLQNGNTFADKVKKAYADCFGSADYDFGDLAAKEGSKDSDNDGLPDSFENNEQCFYKKMGWVNEADVLSPDAIKGDLAGLESGTKNEFDGNIDKCASWNGDFGSRRKREAGETETEEEASNVPSVMESGSSALGWLKSAVRKARSAEPGNGNGNPKRKKRRGGKPKKPNRRSGKKGQKRSKKGNKRPSKTRKNKQRQKKPKKNKNNNGRRKRKGGKTRKNKPRRNGGTRKNNKSRRRGGKKEGKGRRKPKNGKTRTAKKGKKGNKNRKKKTNRNRQDKKGKRNGGKNKGGKKNGKNTTRKNKNRGNKKAGKSSTRKNGKNERNNVMADSTYNKLWCFDLSLEQVLEKCVENKIKN